MFWFVWQWKRDFVVEDRKGKNAGVYGVSMVLTLQIGTDDREVNATKKSLLCPLK